MKWMHLNCGYCMTVNICILFFTKLQFSNLTLRGECFGCEVINAIVMLRNSAEIGLQDYQCIGCQFCFDRFINLRLWVWVCLLGIVLKNSSYTQYPATFFLSSSWSVYSFCSSSPMYVPKEWLMYVHVPCLILLFSRCTRFLVCILEIKK